MKKIAVANRKGGVGKTTSAVHIAAGLALAGRRVLLIDTDGQGHCSKLLGVKPAHGLADLLEGRLEALQAVSGARLGLDLLAGGKELAGANRLIARESIRPELMLSRALAPFDGAYDFVILDSSPSFTELSVNVLFYADAAVVPVSMEILAAEGLVSFAEEIERIREYHDLALQFVLPTFLDARVKKTSEILEALRDRYVGQVAPGIHYSAALSEASGWGKTIFEYRPRDRAAADYAEAAGRVAA